MAVERQRWVPQEDIDGINARLRRSMEVLDTSARVQVSTQNTTATLALTWPDSLVESDTTAGVIVLSFPVAATVPGFRVAVVKTAGGNTLTVNGVAVATFATWVSTGVVWRQVG